MKAYLTVGEMGRMFGLNVQTLHYYDKIGLLKPVKVDALTGYRYYSQPQMEEMLLIQRPMRRW